MGDLIALRPTFVRGRARAVILARLQRICGSVALELATDGRAFRVLGPAMPHHAYDPFLPTELTRLQPDLRIEQVPSFRRNCATYDLCLEDSWSGYFVARWLRASAGVEDVVFIHCDHHTDMMPSLLARCGDGLIATTGGGTVDLNDEEDWAKAIASGEIGIGTFVTALFYLRHRLHVRHVNNYSTSAYATYAVARAIQHYPEIPGKGFAIVRKRMLGAWDSVGTYRGGCDAARVLVDLPAGKVIVHIDLDYLINDFNGNPTPEGWSPNLRDREVAAAKIEALVDAPTRASVRVERWIVATSPGFCSAFHWTWLLEEIERAIVRLSVNDAPDDA
jgi:hypothetical protein